MIHKYIKVMISLLLIFSFIFQPYSIYAVEYNTQLSADKSINSNTAIEKVISAIRSFNSECTWTNTTSISSCTPTYDINETLNGYIYELRTKDISSGFIQVLLTSDNTFIVDSYSFSGEHNALKAIRNNMSDDIFSYDTSKLIYSGGFSYSFKKKESNSTAIKAFDVLSRQEVNIEYNINLSHFNYTDNRSIAEPTAFGTKTVYVLNYKSFSLNSYDTISNSERNKCQIICLLNISRYWKECRNKTNMFDINTLSELEKLLPVKPGLLGGISSADAYNKYQTYIKNRGYSIVKKGTLPSTLWTWSNVKFIIDQGIPFTASDATHAVAVFGYQYQVEVDESLIPYGLVIADPQNTTTTYKAFSSFVPNTNANSYAFYVGI
ncbi:MAG: hypothetical protein SOR38_01320 [Oscillospiraceae bacterium]|nr:hypothetical protein [Oscillospiraceae bacterium]MDY3064435.1 hypothetical protein [Oscillospiraceae bacterium]